MQLPQIQHLHKSGGVAGRLRKPANGAMRRKAGEFRNGSRAGTSGSRTMPIPLKVSALKAFAACCGVNLAVKKRRAFSRFGKRRSLRGKAKSARISLSACIQLLATGYWLLATGYWLPASGYWLLATGFWLLATGFWLLLANWPYLRRQFCRDLLGHERFDRVADLDVVVVGDADAAFHSVGHFAGIVLEALERGEFAFINLDAVAH